MHSWEFKAELAYIAILLLPAIWWHSKTIVHLIKSSNLVYTNTKKLVRDFRIGPWPTLPLVGVADNVL